MKLTLAQLRALVALAEYEAATGVSIENTPWLGARAVLAAPTTYGVAHAERAIVEVDGVTTHGVDAQGRIVGAC